MEGAHTLGENDKSIGICLIGNFDKNEVPKNQLKALANLIKDIWSRYGKLEVYGHFNFSKKTCPGLKFPWKELSSMLKNESIKTRIKNELNNIKLSIKHIEDLLNKIEEKVEKPKYKYEVIYKTHIVKINPLDLKITDERDKAGTQFNTPNFVTACYIGHHSDGSTYPTSMLVSEGRIINNIQPNGLYSGIYKGKGRPTPTFIVYKNGDVKLKIINDISKESNVWFAVSGYCVKPFTNKGFEGYEKSICYETHRVGIGYNSKDGYAYLIYRPYTTCRRFELTANNLGLDFLITLDSGGSAKFKVNNKSVHDTTRRLYAGITW